MNKKYKIGIVGGAGYTAGELLRILIHHPNADIAYMLSSSNAGKKVYEIHTDLLGDTEITFSKQTPETVDVLFICMGHKNSKKFLSKNFIPIDTKIIDLSKDFRLEADAVFKNRSFVYGLPEWQIEQIRNAKNIANPGCFATALQLALLPLAKQKWLTKDIHVHGITGATGAGQQPTKTTHFSWRNNNISVYKAFVHQHLDEVYQSIQQLQTDFSKSINFIPLRGNFSRGILVSVYTEINYDFDKIYNLYKNYYHFHPFTIVTKKELSLKDVINTNKCLLKIEKIKKKILITVIIDNLLKGASGQAVQNMNIMLGLEETTGLAFKSIAF